MSAPWSESEINPLLPLEKGQVIRHNLLISNSRYMRCYQRVGDSEQPTLPTVRTQASHNPPVWRDSCKEICFRGADKSVKSRPTLSAYLDSRERGRKFTLPISSATVHIYGESNRVFGKYKYQKKKEKKREETDISLHEVSYSAKCTLPMTTTIICVSNPASGLQEMR